ncbi:MAG: hypothetical protein R3B70_33350 [Polyangiaceae bacterium]
MSFPRKFGLKACAGIGFALALPTAAGCFALGQGLDPPLQQFYYPTALARSPGGKALYVVSSDFDIQYTGGTVHAVDLTTLRTCLGPLVRKLADGASAKNACDAVGLGLNEDPVIVPGPCAPLDTEAAVTCTLADQADAGEVAGPLIRSTRIVGAFGSSAVVQQNPDPAPGEPLARLFVAVRGDPSVTYFDITDDEREPEADPFRLLCGADGASDEPLGGRCGVLNQVGISPYQASRPIRLPVEPVGIAASDGGPNKNVFPLVTVHQTTAAAALVVNKWGVDPTVEHVLGGLPNEPSDVAAIPTPAYLTTAAASGMDIDYAPTFVTSYRASRAIDLLRYYDDNASSVPRHFLQRIDGFFVQTNTDGSDSRGVAIDASERRACEAECDEDLACLRTCVSVPLGLYVANRAPASLLIGEIQTILQEQGGAVTGAVDKLTIHDMVPLTAGASRVIAGDVLDPNGKRAPRIFVVSFDSRHAVIYNPRERRVEATITTGRGPHALAVDIAEDPGDGSGHAYLYVAHFTDSYVGVVDLDMRNARTYGSMIAAVGKPTPPRE